MSLIQESYLQNLLNECEANFGREEKEAKTAVANKLTEVESIMKKNIKQSFANYSLEVIVRFMEFAVEVKEKFGSANQFVNLFFERVTAPSQFYIRALLVKAKLIAYKGHEKQLKGEAMIAALKQSILEINKALDLISGPSEPAQKGKDSKGGADSNKNKYGFLIYNASTCLYKIIRFMLRQNWQKNFTQIVERIYKLFQQIDEPDHNWRCRLMLILFQCLYDSDKKPDAWKTLDLLWDKAKSKNVDFLDSLFRLRVHYSKQNNALTNVIKKDIEGADPNGWKILQVLQRMRSGAIPQAQVQKQLMGVVNQISLGVLSTNEQSASITLSSIMQERLGEAGRIALKFNIINIANSIINFLAKARQPNQKAMVLNQYNKAELLIKKKNQFIDKKTGMMMNSTEIKELQIERRKEALKILQKVMMVNKKLDNADLIYQGAVLIWNISLPFLCPQYRENVVKVFDYSCQLLEQIDSIDHDLRVKMHLELAKIYFNNYGMLEQVEKHTLKAIKLDHSIPTSKLQHKFEPEEDSSLYYRPFERYLHSFREKLIIKKGSGNQTNAGRLDNVINKLWNVVDQKSETTRINTLQNCLDFLYEIKQLNYTIDESKMLVEEEIKQQKILFEQQKLKEYKKKKLLAYDIAQLSFEWELNDFAKKACKFVLEDKWEGKNSIELIIAQARCCYFLAQIEIDEMIQDNYEVPYAQPVFFQNEEEKQGELTEEKKKQIEARKKSIFEMFGKGLELAESIQQHWLVFNGAIYLWNNFLHVFRNPTNDSKLHKDLCAILKKFFESMKNSLKEIEAKGIVYYDLDVKIQAFANVGLVYARFMESQKQPDQVAKVCDALLVTPLSPHTRKLTNSMKARVTGGKSGGPAKDQKKGGKDVPQQKSGGYSDSFLFEIFSQLEIIQNSTNKTQTENLIKKCYENLQNWQPKDKDESQLELHAQLWARLARLAVNQGTAIMYKYALRCSEYSFSLLDNEKGNSTIPPNRLRWYSLSEFLYSECLFKIANPETQDSQSYEKLLFGALQHAVEAAHKGYKSNVNALVCDGAKQVWNVCSKLQDSKKNRVKLIQPIKIVLTYLKEIKQENQIDLILLLAQLFFKCANQNNQNKIGEQVADMLFSVVPKNMQKSLWQAKMIFVSKQGKNELQAISNMKQADPSLQSKLWVKLARIANNPKKQHAAYNKAIDILKKENSIQIVEVLIQYSEWQLRVGNQKVKNVVSNLLLASDYLIDIQYGQDEEEQDIQQDKGTVFSRSTRGKKSHGTKSVKSEMKSSKNAKKAVQKKGPSSIKSKGSSGMSRMSRSGRVAKATKSKNTKSIFEERYQEPEPEALNCFHFQRLFRIHTILALISDSVANKIRYALDAKQFLIKILDLSFSTMNKMQKISDKSKNSEQTFLKVPSNLKQWVNFELSKQILDKIKTVEDPNLLSSYTFEKPELTYAYLKSLTDIFNKYGLNYHTIPLLFFKKFIASQILGNKNYTEVVQLKKKLALRKIGYTDPEKPTITQIASQKYKISELQMKMELIKTQSKVIVEQTDENIFQNVQAANLVQPFNSYEAWFDLGSLLIRFGEINSAKNYLKEAYKHFKILGNSEMAGECCIELLIVAFIEGEDEQAMQYALNANKMVKQTKNWNKLLFWSCKLLLSLKKYEDIANFATKIYTTVQQLIVSLDKENSQKLIFESEMIDLKDILILIEIIDLDVRFTESYEEQILNPGKGILTALKQIQERVTNGDLWSLQNYSYFQTISSKIIEFFIFGKDKVSHINKTVFDKMFALTIKIEKKLFDLMKYTLVGSGSQFKKNQLINVYQNYRYVIVNGYCYQSTQQISGENLQKEEDEQKDEVHDLIDSKNQHFKKYIDNLNLQIQKKMMPVPVNLSPIQSGISILENIKTHLAKDSYQEIEWAANYARALTLKARLAGALQANWADIYVEVESEEASLSLDSVSSILQKNGEEKLLDFTQNNKCYEAGQKLYESFIQNTGQTMKEKGFQFLCKLQHCSYQTKILEAIRKNLKPFHKFNSYLNLIETIKMEPQKIRSVLSSDKIYNSFSKFPTYEQCLALVPRNGVYVILQLNVNLSEIYCGILTNQKGQQEYQINTRILKKKVEKSQLSNYWLLKEKINKIKKEIVYLAYSDSKKLDNLLLDKQKNLNEVHQKFIKANQWWLETLLGIINKVKQVEAPVQTDKNKKGAKDAKKKGGKDEVAGYESPLGASPAGFQSISFLVDDFFEGFSFNLLPGLQVVPAISSDSSIFYLSRKMQSIGFKSDANNSNGFGADKGKYISYQFKSPEVGFKHFTSEIIKASPNIKWQGVSSNDRIPSIGDYKKYFSQIGYLQIYGSLDLINHIRMPILLENCGVAKLKLLIVADHLNYEKSLINKFIPLDDESQLNSIDSEMKLIKAIANLLDLNLIKNIWCVNKEQNQKIITNLYKNLGAGYYLGACLNSANKQEQSKPGNLLEKYMFRIHGCPVLRM